ncbi:hypothetical protein Dimus_001234 [Dionaea muscipula]
MLANGLNNLFELIKRQKLENLFAKRDLVYNTACKEFYKNLIVSVSPKKEVARSSVHGFKIEFDGMTLASILEIPRNNGICHYVNEVFEETKYCHPLEITRKFANGDTIMKARRVKSAKMRSFQRLLHIFVMKNILTQFGKRNIASFMDLTYMDYLLTKKKVNFPRVIIRHMAYVINVPHHELPYGELLTRIFHAFDVPLNDKEAEQAVATDKFDETFLEMCQLRRENGVWWLGSGANRDEVENAEVDEEENEEEHEEEDKEQNEEDSEKTVEEDKFAKSTPAAFDWEQIEEEIEAPRSDSMKNSLMQKRPDMKKKGKCKDRGVDPSDTIPDYDLIHLQAEFDRAFKASTRFQELLQQIKPKPSASPRS